MTEKPKALMTRRNAIVAAGTAGAAALAAPFAFRTSGRATLVGAIDPDKIVPLGEGFYLADGWVLSAHDLKGFDLPQPVQRAE